MRRIALEEHFIIDEPAHVERWKTLIPGVPQAITDQLLSELRDVGDRRLAAMSAAGVDFAVLSNIGTVQGMLDPTPALRLARQANDYLADVVRNDSAHFAGFATVPLQDPSTGADELERAVTQLGLKGAMVFGHTNGEYLDNDRFSPFWERAQALGVPVYLHAADPLVMPPTYVGRPELVGATWSWTAETAAHALRIIFSGVFTRYPKTQLWLGHLGETLPYLLWRLNRRAEAFQDNASIKPGDAIRSNVVVTTAGMFSDEPFCCALSALGEESVMFSVDFPFESMADAGTWFDNAPLSSAAREKVSWSNAARLLAL